MDTATHIGSDGHPGHPRRRTDTVDVTVVVVTHQSEDDIGPCLDGLLSLTDRSTFEIVVVDNASTDGTLGVVASRPGIHVIRQPRRGGFSVNVNAGLAIARGRHVFLLNPDAVVEDGVLDQLCEHLERHGEVGAVAPRLRYPDGRPQANARRFPSLGTAVVRRTPLRAVLPAMADTHLEDTEFHGVRDVDWCLGAALLVRGSALRQLGGLDEGYRLYCEDVDLCWRLHEAGWRVQQLASPVMTHALGEHTAKHFLTRRTVWHLRSAARFARLHGIGGRPTIPSILDLDPEPVRWSIDLRARLGADA